ncbi:MAG: DUF1844 domain-containing protein [Syntrophales bacterium]|nr:DUF1844 domain-containing protein [Syntrophales bacterium]MDD5532885.1 DUF1844 domain-containing protein [Syntrophales bacterium]
MSDVKNDKGFVVKDRRQFDSSGAMREDDESRAGKEQPPREEKAGRKPESKESSIVPEINFSNFILSLGTSVVFHFGDIPDPVTKKAERNLDAAKQSIDIISMLEEKTRGNLDENEKKLMTELLYELRMRYVREKEKG